MVGGLEQFGQHVLEFLWNSFQKHFTAEKIDTDPLAILRADHDNFIGTKNYQTH